MSITRKSKISFSNLEQLYSEVETLETNGKNAYGTISHTLWSYSIYLQFHEELAVQEPIFPLNEKNLKAFLLEISRSGKEIKKMFATGVLKGMSGFRYYSIPDVSSPVPSVTSVISVLDKPGKNFIQLYFIIFIFFLSRD